MSVVLVTIGFVAGAFARPVLSRAVERVRWRLELRRIRKQPPRPTVTTASLDEIIKSEMSEWIEAQARQTVQPFSFERKEKAHDR